MDAKRKFSDIFLLYAARALRGFGDGFAIIVLPAYMAAIGFNAAQIGLVAAAALFGNGGIHAGRRLSRAALRFAKSADRRRRLDDLHRPGVSAGRGHRLSDRGGVFRHHQSLDRRHRRAHSARARHAHRRRSRPRAHAHLRALQPDRRAVDGGRRARRGRAGFPGPMPASRGSARSGRCSTPMPFWGWPAPRSTPACRTPMPSSGRRPRRSRNRAASSTSSRRCSASTPLPADFACSR